MKIAEVRQFLSESFNFSKHINFEDYLFSLNVEEDEEVDTWGDDIKKECQNDKDFISYKDAKGLYDKLSNGDKQYVSPNGKYVDSPSLIFRLGEEKDGELIGFIDVYYFANKKESKDKDGFITMAVDPAHRGKGIAKKLLNRAVEKAKKVGFKALTYEVDNENKRSINFIQKVSNKFKNETPKDSKTVVFRYHLAKEEDEMTTAILGGTPSDTLHSGDNYASGDMRVPKVLGKIQRRRKTDEDAEDAFTPLYRYMDLEELNNIIAYNAFTDLIDFEDDCEGKIQNPAGMLPFFKSFTYKLTKNGLNDFMGENHIICVFSGEAIKATSAKNNKTKLIKYEFDNAPGSIHEYEYRLFSEANRVPVQPVNIIKKIIFCKQSGKVNRDDIESLLLDLSYSGINVPVEYIANPINAKSKKIIFSLDENDSLVETKA